MKIKTEKSGLKKAAKKHIGTATPEGSEAV
jgi:hypothetical protein